MVAAGEWFFSTFSPGCAHSTLTPLSKIGMAAKQRQLLDYRSYSPDLAPADFFFLKMKEELAGHQLTQEDFKRAQDFFKRSQGYFKRSQDYFKRSQDYFERSQDYFKRSQDYFKKVLELLQQVLGLLQKVLGLLLKVLGLLQKSLGLLQKGLGLLQKGRGLLITSKEPRMGWPADDLMTSSSTSGSDTVLFIW